jgi:hypothetical protein
MKHLYLKEVTQKIKGAVNILRATYRQGRIDAWEKEIDQKILKELSGQPGIKATIAVLNPPKYGELNFVTSYSFVEIIDVLCEGPIAGISVNKIGSYNSKAGIAVTDSKILNGIYLDSIPIAVD